MGPGQLLVSLPLTTPQYSMCHHCKTCKAHHWQPPSPTTGNWSQPTGHETATAVLPVVVGGASMMQGCRVSRKIAIRMYRIMHARGFD